MEKHHKATGEATVHGNTHACTGPKGSEVPLGAHQNLNLCGVTGKSTTVRSKVVALDLITEQGKVTIEAASVPEHLRTTPLN